MRNLLNMPDNLHKGASFKLFSYARQNRRVMTYAEKILWDNLRNKKLKGFKFRRQHPVSDFIADFFCLEANLVVEIDGTKHSERDQKEYDDGRTYELKELGIRVIRFTNREVEENVEFVVKHIERCLVQ